MGREASAEVQVITLAAQLEGDALRAFALADDVATQAVALEAQHDDPGVVLPRIVRLLGERGLLRYVVESSDGGALERVSSRCLCAIRERLGRASPLVELAFAMQGLGSYPITYAKASSAARQHLAAVSRGEAVAAFAITEPDAGSDLGAISTRATKSGDGYLLTGRKHFISNAGIASFYVVFARTADSEKRWLSAFVVPATTTGLSTQAMSVLGGHPIGELALDQARVDESMRLGAEGTGMEIALATLTKFRPTVGAAAVGFAQRALDEATAHVKSRKQFGAPLADREAVRLSIAAMACEIEAARLLVERAAQLADDPNASREQIAYAASMAKLVATESAQRVVDAAVQLHGGRGVLKSSIVARLYEDVRALRIYEGASDVQRLLIARALLSGNDGAR